MVGRYLEQYVYQVFKCIPVDLVSVGKLVTSDWPRGYRLDTRNGTIRAVVRVRIIATKAAATTAAAAAGIIRVGVAGARGLGVQLVLEVL